MEFDDNNVCKIKVVGVGGGGNNAINRMVAAGIRGAKFIAVNTDKQDLQESNAHDVLQIGKELTKGLGAGANPEIGRRAAEESEQEIREMLKDTNLLFITAGLGGGTGNGAAPVIARIAHEMGILTIGVVTTPFRFEAPRRSSNAAQGIEEMRKYVDSLVIIPNEKLYEILKKDVSFVDAFRYADDVLRQAIQGVSELISVPGLINLDFADVSTIMKDKGIVHMGIGRGEGENKTIKAINKAVTSPLLETSIEGATGIIINIVGGKDLTLSEVYEAVDLVRQVADPNCNVIFGARINNDLSGVTETSVIATGFDERNRPARQVVPEFKDNSANIKTFTEPSEEEEEPKEEPKVEPKAEPKPEVAEEKVEDISIQPKKPFLDDEDLPPFLRKLRK